MNLSEMLTLAGLITIVVTSITVVIASFRTNTSKVWKEEAEAQKTRADRLEVDLTEIKDRLKHIQRDNEQLFQLVAAISPNHLASIRATYHPPEV